MPRLATVFVLAVALHATLGNILPVVHAADGEENSAWNVEDPPGKSIRQPIEVTEGTWMNIDLSPDGKTIVFDLLGDIYAMPTEHDGVRKRRN